LIFCPGLDLKLHTAVELQFITIYKKNQIDVELRNGKLSNEEFFRFRQNLNCALNQNFFKRLIEINQVKFKFSK
jgi:hypothetical protein